MRFLKEGPLTSVSLGNNSEMEPWGAVSSLIDFQVNEENGGK